MNSINRLWEFHNLSDSDFKANFDNYYDKVNMVDFYLLINFLLTLPFSDLFRLLKQITKVTKNIVLLFTFLFLKT